MCGIGLETKIINRFHWFNGVDVCRVPEPKRGETHVLLYWNLMHC